MPPPRSAGAEHEMKKALKRGDDGTLNVYTTSGGAYLGWAYLPEITDTAQAVPTGSSSTGAPRPTCRTNTRTNSTKVTR